MSIGRYTRQECGGNPGYPASVQNGKVPTQLMRRLKSQSHLGTGPGRYLVPEGSKGFDAMVVAAKKAGISLRLLGGYRTYAKQVQLKKQWADKGKPEYAAKPGTSNHGWATGYDVDRHSKGTEGIVEWMKKHARHYGWDHPTWAGDGRSPEEPWHWEYIRGWKMSEKSVREPIVIGDQIELAKGYIEDGTSWSWVRHVAEDLDIRIVTADGQHCVLEREGFSAKTFAASQGTYRHENGEGYIPLGELDDLGYTAVYGTSITMRDTASEP